MTRPRPASTPDTRWWWDAVAAERLQIQRCDSCSELRHPPVPSCPHCRSLEWTPTDASGRGMVHSFTVLHHPPLAGFDYPLVAAVIQLDEGTRLVSNVVGVGPSDVRIGMTVEVEFAHGLPLFRPVAP